MNEKLFRKASIERLSSPEQLDQVLRVTSPLDWAVLAALFLIIGATGVWTVKGSIATKVSGQAVIVRTGGMISVTAPATGQIVSLNVAAGQKVRANQVIARIAQPTLSERMRAAEDALSEARREGDRSVRVRREASKLEVATIGRQRRNLEREIGELGEQARLAAEQIPVEEQLLAKGLITRQQVIAAKQKHIGIEAEIARHRAQLTQLDAQQFTTESQPASVEAESRVKVADLERRVSELRQEIAMASTATTPYAGQVVEVKVQPGAAVNAGTPILTIQPLADTLEALLYVPANRAKEVSAGMEAQLSPTTVKREEFGYMKGTVVAVAEFPATQAALMRNFENESLVQAIVRDGPVTEMRVRLEVDEGTPSGFKWSSSRGPKTQISAGTLSTALVVTREQKPLTLVVPLLREKLGI